MKKLWAFPYQLIKYYWKLREIETNWLLKTRKKNKNKNKKWVQIYGDACFQVDTADQSKIVFDVYTLPNKQGFLPHSVHEN